MPSIVVEHLGKCYRLGKRAGQAPWLSGLGSSWGLRGSKPPEKRPPRELWALRDVSFQVEPGTILGVIGPNGAGKTTLLKVLGRVTLPTEGRAIVRGRVVSLLEVGAGFQPELTGRENIFLHAALYGVPRREVHRRLEAIVEFAELKDFIDTPVRRYSSGMYLRLAFSVAINMEPQILLADEVLAVGDLAFQERCLQRVKEAGAAGLTVLFVSHDMEAITRLCDRVMWLSTGQMVECGKPEDIVARYEKSAWTLMAEKLRKGKKGSNADGELLSTRLFSTTGKEVGAVRMSDEVMIKVAFNMSSAGVSIRAAFDVYSRGIHVFRSVQPKPFDILRPGVYSASIRIPAHLLLDTIYTVNTSVTIIRGNKESYLVEYNAAIFQVYDTDDEHPVIVSNEGKRRLAGVIAPRLDWNVAQERDVVAR